MKILTVLVAVLALAIPTAARAEPAPEKRREINTLIRLTGLEQLMNQMKDQMLATMSGGSRKIPAEILKRISMKLDVSVIMEKIVPIYDKYYTLEDLQAINAFYSSPAGQKVLSTLPQVMQESMVVGQQWGEQAGRELEAEMAAEAKAKPQ